MEPRPSRDSDFLWLIAIGVAIWWFTGGVDIGPNPVPIPVGGLHVLIVEETADRGALPAGQREILLATAPGSVREYLETHAKGNFRILDKDGDVSKDGDTWQAVWQRPRATLPWLVAWNGRAGYEGPLPGTAAETLAILRKYGGA